MKEIRTGHVLIERNGLNSSWSMIWHGKCLSRRMRSQKHTGSKEKNDDIITFLRDIIIVAVNVYLPFAQYFPLLCGSILFEVIERWVNKMKRVCTLWSCVCLYWLISICNIAKNIEKCKPPINEMVLAWMSCRIL